MQKVEHKTYVDAWKTFIEKNTPLMKDYYKKEEEFFLNVPLKNMIVLDMGCGEGRFTNLLARTAKEVIGIDVDPSVLAIAKERNANLSNVKFLQENCLNTHFEDSYFDYVFAPDLIANLADKKVTAISEMARITKPGGSVFITAYSEHALADRLTGYENARVPYRVVDKEKGFVLLNLAQSTGEVPSEQFSKQDLRDLCRQASQTKIRVEALNKLAYVCVIDVQK